MIDSEREAFGASYPDHGKLMCFEDGRRLHPDTITSRFNRLVDQAGVRRIRLHDYADTCLMPTSGRSACSAVVSGLKMSA
jgi:hypothetical protein